MLTFTQYSRDGDRLEHAVDQVLARGRTAYQEYLFFRSPAHGVCVALDGDIQSCASDEAIYHEALVHPAMLLHPAPKRVLVMGGGEGATAREVLRHACVERVTMVDIDAEFVELCRQHLADWNREAFSDARLELQCRDIHEFLAGTEARFDVVIGDLVDVEDWDSPTAALYGRDLYGKLRARLNNGAVIATQAGGLTTTSADGHRHVRDALGARFRHVASYGIIVPSFCHLWSFVVASDRELPLPDQPPLAEFMAHGGERELDPPATGLAGLAGSFALPAAIRRRILQQD